MTAEQVFIAEKFAPCPQCRSFSLEIIKSGKQKKKGISGRIWFACDNCGYRFSARIAREGDTLKTIAKRDRAFVIKNIVIATLAAAALLFLTIKISQWIGTPEVKPAVSKKENARLVDIQKQANEPAAKSVKKKIKKQAEAKIQIKPEPVKPQRTKTESSKVKEKEKPESVKEKSLSMEITPQKKVPKPQASVQQATIKPTSTKVFDLSYMKVRRTYPNSSDPTHRWFFKKQTVTIKRSSEQRVYIASDERGRRAWAADDEIRINGQRIKGSSQEITEIGVIPHAVKVPPHDITALVPAGVEVKLDIRLVDYGIFWGNTAIYIVVK